MTSLQSTRPRHGRPARELRIALLATRPSPDGFNDPIVEVGDRLVDHGHTLSVLATDDSSAVLCPRPGIRTVRLPPIRDGLLGSLTRDGLAWSHLLLACRQDVVFVLDSASTSFIPLLRSRGTAVAVHVDGFERARPGGRPRVRAAGPTAARAADALIADAQWVQDDHIDEFGITTELIRPGATIVERSSTDLVERLGLVPKRFHLTCLDPLARVDVVTEGYHRSRAEMPLVVLRPRSIPDQVIANVTQLARRDPRILVVEADRPTERQLYAHALSALHGASSGRTRPLLRAMGAGAAIVAWDDVADREVAGVAGSYFSSPADLARAVEEVERYDFRFRDLGDLMQERAKRLFDWDVAAEQYATLASRLARGYSTHGAVSARRGRHQ